MEIEHSTEEKVRREVAADRLRALADELSRHNEVSFLRDGQRFTIAVPDEVTFTLEVEVGEEPEIEVELKW
jgi:amphi-Trp domain-containing protein